MRRIVPATLRQKAALAAVLIVLLAVGNILVLRWLHHESDAVASTLNVAGKMRMLSQRIGMEALARHADPTRDGTADTIAPLRARLDDAWRILHDGGTALGLTIPALPARHRTLLEDIAHARMAYAAALSHMHDSASIDRALQESQHLLRHTEALMDALTLEAEQLHASALRGAYLLFLLDLLVLGLGFLVFRRRLLCPIQSLAWQGREQAAGNYAARSRIQGGDELAALGQVLNDSSAHMARLLAHLRNEHRALAQAKALFDGLTKNTLAAIYTLDKKLRITYANAVFGRITGHDPHILSQGYPLERLFPPKAFVAVRRSIEARLENPSLDSHYESSLRHKDGHLIDIEVFGSSTDVEGQRVIIGILLDITERKRSEALSRRAALVYKHTSEAMVIATPEARVLDINPAFTAVTGYTRADIIGQKVSRLSSGRHDKAFYAALWHSLLEHGHWRGDIHNRRKNGEEYIEHLSINALRGPDGSVEAYVGLFSDVTRRRQDEAAIWHQAHFDYLTQLPNRKMFQDALQHSIRLSHGSGKRLALLFLDLDLFKAINDTYGHDMGDTLLKHVAQRLRASVRDRDAVARMGGDEFTVIIRELGDHGNLDIICRNILHALGQPYHVGDDILRVTVSIGVSLFPDHGEDDDSLLRHADIAMYAAKSKGRNQYHVFSSGMLDDVRERRDLTQDLHAALSNAQFRLYYQPIIALRSGRIARFEALVRWAHPERGLVSPMAFIPLAEQTGLINPIGQWVFETATAQLARWRAQYNPRLEISVNVSPVQLLPGGLDVAQWEQALRDAGLPLEALTLEITEGLLMETDPDFRRNLRAVQASGMRLALDDFGTGYSSISYLKRFDIDTLKIDRSFIQNITTSTQDLSLCQGMIHMAHAMGMTIVAEGVETRQQHELLTRAGCDYGQGYWYDRPLSAQEIEARECKAR